MFGAPSAAFPLAVTLKSVLLARRTPAVMRLGFPYVSSAGLEALMRELDACEIWEQGDKFWLVGIHQGVTEPAALRRLGGLAASEVRVFSATGDMSQRALRGRPMFHAKVVGVEPPPARKQPAPLEALIVSSANLTGAAIGSRHTNYEAGAVLHDLGDVTSTAWYNWWRSAWDAAIPLSNNLIDRYAELREAFIRSNPVILEIADPPSTQTLKNANTFWIEAGAMSGGSRNQVEFNRELAAFFGPVLNRQRKLSIDIGRQAWDDRPLSPKVTTFGVEIWRLSLPTASSGGFQYQGKVIRFRRSASPKQRLEVDVADVNSSAARAWRSKANRTGYLGTTSGDRAFGFF